MKNSVLLLTGSNGGLGLEIAEYLIQSGFKSLACHYKSSDERIRQLLNKYDLPVEKHLFQSDLTDEDSVSRLRQQITERLGSVTYLVNLAGGSTNKISWKMTKQEFMSVVEMNLLSTFLSCREFIPLMREKKFGRIINISSIVAFTGTAGASHYCAAKSGIIGFSKSLSLELASFGITVNSLVLGYFNQGLINHISENLKSQIINSIPLKRLGSPNEIGSLIKYLIGTEAGYMTGQSIHINGGLYS